MHKNDLGDTESSLEDNSKFSQSLKRDCSKKTRNMRRAARCGLWSSPRWPTQLDFIALALSGKKMGFGEKHMIDDIISNPKLSSNTYG